METLLDEGRGDETDEPCEDFGSFGSGGNAHGLRNRLWWWKHRDAGSDGPLGCRRQGLVQRQRRRGSGRERQVVLQRQRRCRQVVLQRVWRTCGPEILTTDARPSEGRPGVFI